jgi:hypothetical protein
MNPSPARHILQIQRFLMYLISSFNGIELNNRSTVLVTQKAAKNSSAPLGNREDTSILFR